MKIVRRKESREPALDMNRATSRGHSENSIRLSRREEGNPSYPNYHPTDPGRTAWLIRQHLGPHFRPIDRAPSTDPYQNTAAYMDAEDAELVQGSTDTNPCIWVNWNRDRESHTLASGSRSRMEWTSRGVRVYTAYEHTLKSPFVKPVTCSTRRRRPSSLHEGHEELMGFPIRMDTPAAYHGCTRFKYL